MCGGVEKSGSPAPKPMTSSPAACNALYFASTANVADSVMAPTRRETRLMFPMVARRTVVTQTFWRRQDAISALLRRQNGGFVPTGQVREAGVVREDLHEGLVQAEPALHRAHVV